MVHSDLSFSKTSVVKVPGTSELTSAHRTLESGQYDHNVCRVLKTAHFDVISQNLLVFNNNFTKHKHIRSQQTK